MASKLGKGGFTFTELLAATVILMLSTALIAQSLVIGYRHFFAQTQRSEAGLLLSSLQNAVQDELTYASSVTTEGSADADGYSPVASYTSYRAGASSRLFSTDGGSGERGQVVLTGKRLGDTRFSIVAPGAYAISGNARGYAGRSYGLAAELSVSYRAAASDENGQFLVNLSVYSADASATDSPLASSTFYVIPVGE